MTFGFGIHQMQGALSSYIFAQTSMSQVRAIVVYDTLLQEVKKEKYNHFLARMSARDSGSAGIFCDVSIPEFQPLFVGCVILCKKIIKLFQTLNCESTDLGIAAC